MKRLYSEAATVAVGEGRWRVELDGRAIKTPSRAELVVPNGALAESIAGEWAAQGEKVVPQSMPMTALACTALDLVATRRGDIVAELSAYAETDLVCYRADHPPELVRRQSAVWQPLLDWATLTFDAPLAVTVGVVPQPQPATALAALRRAVEAHDDLALSALSTAVSAAGSLVIGLALSHDRIDAAAAFEAAELDTSYQMEVWGEDEEAARRRAQVRTELEAAERFLALLRAT